MSRISNRFFVTALEDGTTLHGGLASTKPLIQAWDGSAATPNWTDTNEQPVIFLTLYNGSTRVDWNSNCNRDWYFDNNKIVFNLIGGRYVSTDGLFERIDYTINEDGISWSMPALKIINNFTASNMVSAKTIAIRGTYKESEDAANIPFYAAIQLRTTSIEGGSAGYFGLIYFKDGKSVFIDGQDELTLYGKLYSGGSPMSTNDYSITWYVNDTEIKSSNANATHTQLGTEDGYPSLTINKEGVVDNAIIRAVFKPSAQSGTVYYTDYVSIDDLTDPEYLYIQYNNANGNSASLRNGESVQFVMWVGKMDSAEVDTNYDKFYVKILNASGNVYIEDFGSSIPNADTSGDYAQYRKLTTSSNGKATLTITHDDVVACGNNMTGFVLATT